IWRHLDHVEPAILAILLDAVAIVLGADADRRGVLIRWWLDLGWDGNVIAFRLRCGGVGRLRFGLRLRLSQCRTAAGQQCQNQCLCPHVDLPCRRKTAVFPHKPTMAAPNTHVMPCPTLS